MQLGEEVRLLDQGRGSPTRDWERAQHRHAQMRASGNDAYRSRSLAQGEGSRNKRSGRLWFLHSDTGVTFNQDLPALALFEGHSSKVIFQVYCYQE